MAFHSGCCKTKPQVRSKGPLMWNPVFTLFSSTIIKDILPAKQKLICLESSHTIQQALNVLAENKIHSAPLLDENKKYIGMIDNLMILRYIYHESREDAIAAKRKDLSNIPLSQDVIRKKTLDDVLGMLYTSFHSIDMTKSICEDEKVSRAARLFGQGYCRLPVLDAKGNLKGLIAQHDVLRFLAKHACDPSLHMLGHLIIDPEEVDEVVSISGDVSLSQALEKMFKTGISCLAVECKQTGRLVGHFSAYDLQSAFGGAQWPSNDLTIAEYLSEYSPESMKPIVISSGASLIDAINELCQSNVRHIWGIDREMHARLCIGMKDVFSKLSEFRLLRDADTASLLSALIEQDPFSLMSHLSSSPLPRNLPSLVPSQQQRQISTYPTTIAIGTIETSPVEVISLRRPATTTPISSLRKPGTTHVCTNKEKANQPSHICAETGALCVHTGTKKEKAGVQTVEIKGTTGRMTEKKKELTSTDATLKSKWKTGEQIEFEKQHKLLSQDVVVNTKHTKDNTFLILIYLPQNAKKEDVSLKYKNNKILATVKLSCKGRSYGDVVREIHLPIGLLLDRIEAHHEDGCLKITIPKEPMEKAKTSININ